MSLNQNLGLTFSNKVIKKDADFSLCFPYSVKLLINRHNKSSIQSMKAFQVILSIKLSYIKQLSGNYDKARPELVQESTKLLQSLFPPIFPIKPEFAD